MSRQQSATTGQVFCKLKYCHNRLQQHKLQVLLLQARWRKISSRYKNFPLSS